MENQREQCRQFETCNAPLCPMDTENHRYLWYFDEDICSKSGTKDIFLKVQRKISKVENVEGYFTVEMLSRGPTVGKGITGIDPNKDEEIQLKKWLKSHQPRKKRIMSEEDKEALKERLKEGLERSKNDHSIKEK